MHYVINRVVIFDNKIIKYNIMITWKGQTFNQIIAQRQRNKGIRTSPFSPSPLKIYRKELVKSPIPCTYSSVSIDDFTTPGANIVNNNQPQIFIADLLKPNSKTETLESNSKCVACVDNARRRVRSSGNFKNTFGIAKDVLYYTSRTQYLNSRQKQYEQNNYSTYIKSDPIFTDEKINVKQNVYLPGTKASVQISLSGYQTTPLFQYVWINGNTYDVYFPDGNYYLDDLNIILHNTMQINKHYLIDTYNSSTSYIYFMKLVYNCDTDRIQLQCMAIDTTLYSQNRYETWTSYLVAADWLIPRYTLIPSIKILDNEFLDIIGFVEPGLYPPETVNPILNTQPATLTDPVQNKYLNKKYYFVNGSVSPLIKTQYLAFSYKPSNNRFAQNGGVTSSTVTASRKYDTITEGQVGFNKNGNLAYSLAYAVAPPGYSIKYVKGFDNKECKNLCTN
jgi:hypothetical protein